MNEIELMLTGQIGIKTFLAQLKADFALQQQLRNLLPIEAIDNKDYALWKRISFDTFKKYNFDLYYLLIKMFRFNDSIADNLNIFGTIKSVYCYSHPNTVCTTMYSDMFNLYLSVIKDCFDGPEVRAHVYKIIEEAYALRTKKARIEKAKNDIRVLFHQDDSLRPRWIHGPEWPMGIYSPMKFIKQKSFGESVKYIFKDVDTGEEKSIVQFY